MTSPHALILCRPTLCSECIKWHVSIVLFNVILRIQHSFYVVHKMHNLFTYDKLFTFFVFVLLQEGEVIDHIWVIKNDHLPYV